MKTGMIGSWAALALLAAGAVPFGPAWAADDPVQSAFVVLGDNGAAQARVITTDAACPSVLEDGKTIAMTVRAAPATLPLRGTKLPPEENKPAVYPVTVCEATLPKGRMAMVGVHRLPLPVSEPKRIVVIGDTGCRIKTSDKAAQACNDIHEYPFSRIAASAAAYKPDLVIHVGDYLYRESPCPAGNAGCAGSVSGYGWDSWNADFFAPGAPLLAAAPWAAARGNHESCNRAGQGWWRMMEPRALAPGRDCIKDADDGVGDYDDPIGIPIGDGAQVILLDSSNVTGDPLDPASHMAMQYKDSYRKFAILAAKSTYSIMVEHHPLLAPGAHFKGKGPDQRVELYPGNLALQSVYGDNNPWYVPTTVKLLLAGHVHVFEQISYSTNHPSQFIAGFSGTQEDIAPVPKVLPADFSVAPGTKPDAFSSWVDGFGFMTMERTGKESWNILIHDMDGKVVNHCTAKGNQSHCDIDQVMVPKPQ